ncbi:MAG: phage tail sheath family protein [Sphingomonadales bacterium]|nr:MAG: phage tail sheath family protein [Sphingomonadales bacterium]
MAPQYKTPGVYIQEPDSFPPSIVGVETAVPCFIGYTEKAVDTDLRSLHLLPRRIASLTEYVQMFGAAYLRKYYLLSDSVGAGRLPESDRNWGWVSLDGVNPYLLAEDSRKSFNLYDSMRLFYANGGGSCYVVSVGDYSGTIEKAALLQGVEVCASFIGPTMVAIPDAVLMSDDDARDLNVAMLRMCRDAGDRMALIDLWGMDKVEGPHWESQVASFRKGLRAAGPESMQFGAAYFPSLVTSIVAPEDIDMASFVTVDADKLATLKLALGQALQVDYPAAGEQVEGTGISTLNDKGKQIYATCVDRIGADTEELALHQLTQALASMVPGFQRLRTAIAATQNVLPPSGAMAGVWAMNDAVRGVWNAPVNTGIAGLVQPALPISGNQQDDLNVPVDGLSINAIRTFQGRGTLIWGARTLDGNSNDWRYIQVRRTMIYVEQSVKQALQTMAFNPNTAQTWATVASMIESFLHNLWAAGGLMGAKPSEAFSVQCGLGSTMTSDDVLNGVMRVQTMVQMVRPAEFMVLTIEQQMLAGA